MNTYMNTARSLTLPGFTSNGALPSGEHTTDWQNFSKRFGFNAYRRRYLRCFESFVFDFRARGGEEVFIGGSFVTCKAMPSDIDFSIAMSRLERTKLEGLMIPKLQLRRKQLAPLHFIPEYVAMDEGEFSAREFFKNDKRGLNDNSIGIVVLKLQVS